MRELCFANECLPEDRRVRKRLGSESAWIARPGNARIDVFSMRVCAEDPPFLSQIDVFG